MSSHLRQYLVLIRIPNVFTALSNILVGYFSLTHSVGIDLSTLFLLMMSSSLLYISGIVFNDYFDVATDMKERPERPLPSGRVSKRGALILAIATLLVANSAALVVGMTSFLISSALSATIIAYDYSAKRGRLGPMTMGLARSLNVFLGASPALFLTNNFPWMTLFAALLMLAYVYAITMLSRREVLDNKKHNLGNIIRQPFSIIGFVVLSVIVFAVYQRSLDIYPFLALFGIVVSLTWRQAKSGNAPQVKSIQNAVRNLVLSIIIMDSILVSGFAGIYFGIATLVLVVPSILLARKHYVT